MKKVNPIAEQSRKWLAESLFDLMKKQRYSDITITAISENAQLARRTFYRNFSSREEIIIYACTQICEEYIRYLDRDIEYSIRHIIEVYFTFWQEHIDLLELLTGNNLLCHLIEVSNRYWPMIFERFRKHWGEECSDKELEYCLLFNMGGLWNILIKWIYSSERENPREMERMAGKSLRCFLKSI